MADKCHGNGTKIDLGLTNDVITQWKDEQRQYQIYLFFIDNLTAISYAIGLLDPFIFWKSTTQFDYYANQFWEHFHCYSKFRLI